VEELTTENIREHQGPFRCRRLFSIERDDVTIRSPADEAGEDDDGVRIVTFKAGSSIPITRRSWWGEYEEVIPMKNKKDVNLKWVNSGNAPLLWMHNTREHRGNLKAGRIVEHHGEHKAIEVDAVFYKSVPTSADMLEQVEAGMARNVSIGFSVPKGGHRWEEYDTGEVYQEGKNKGKPIMGDRLVFDEIILDEVSFVTLPADQSVGIGRADNPSAQFFEYIKEVRQMSDKTETDEGTEETPEIPAANADAGGTRTSEEPPTPTVVFDVTGQRWLSKNTKLLQERGVSQESITGLEKLVDGEKGMSEADIKARAFDAVAKVDTETQGQVETRAPSIGGQASQVFSCQRARDCYEDFVRNGKEIDGLEAEVIREFERDNAHWAPERASRDSIFIPHSAIMADPVTRKMMLEDVPTDLRATIERAYTVGATPSGFHTEVFDENWFTAALYAKSMMLQLVRKMPSELAQNLIGVTESGTITILHEGESPTNDTAESAGLSFGTRKLEWHNIRGRKEVSQRTLDQSDKFFPVLLDRMRRYLVIAQEKVLIEGVSADSQPVGIRNLASVPTVAIGTNGGAPTHAHVTDMVTKLRTNNAYAESVCFIVTPEVLGKLEQTPKFTNSQGTPADSIVTNFSGDPKIKGYKTIVSNLLPKGLTKGTSTDCHMMGLIDFSGWMMAMFSAVEMMVDPYSGIGKSLTNVYLRQAYDLVVDHVEQNVVIVDARP